MCKTESASSNTEPIVLTDETYFEVSGGIACTLKARDYKAPQVILITERSDTDERTDNL